MCEKKSESQSAADSSHRLAGQEVEEGDPLAHHLGGPGEAEPRQFHALFRARDIGKIGLGEEGDGLIGQAARLVGDLRQSCVQRLARPDRQEKLGAWYDAFATAIANPSGLLEDEVDFSKPRIAGRATKRRKNK